MRLTLKDNGDIVSIKIDPYGKGTDDENTDDCLCALISGVINARSDYLVDPIKISAYVLHRMFEFEYAMYGARYEKLKQAVLEFVAADEG